MTLLYISTDLNVNSSGGIVAQKELEAMKSMGEKVIQLDYRDIHPSANNLPDIPFLIDYLALNKLTNMDLSKVDLTHMYGGCYNLTIKYLKSLNIKTSFSCMFHERKTSIEEHEKYVGKYPFQHVKDDNLWKMYVVSALQNSNVVITPGKAPRDNILKEAPNARVEIIPHGCDIPDKIPNIPNQFNIGYMGEIGPDKGIVYLIKAWSELNYQDSTLVFAGSKSTHLQELIYKYAISGKFHLMGYVDKLEDFYKNISVYVHPSSTEAFGMEVPESMSYGRPVIVSNGAGSVDCVNYGNEGLIINRMDINSIKKAIQYLKDNPSELIRMSENALEKSKNYSWDNIQQKYINLWRELLS